jgi:hypothetical protein
MRSRQIAERLGVEKAHMLEFQQFTMVWDRKMNEYDTNAHELIEVWMFALYTLLLSSPPLTSPLPSLHSTFITPHLFSSLHSSPLFCTPLLSILSTLFYFILITLLSFPHHFLTSLSSLLSSLLPGHERQTYIRAPSTS